MLENRLTIDNRKDFRNWLIKNHSIEKECWLVVKRGKPVDTEHFWYVDAVEEALCFGWIDSVWKNDNGVMWSRFTPRQSKSPWTELNKERVRRLERLSLMTDAGRQVLPDMDFKIDSSVEKDIKDRGVWEEFIKFPALYQRVRAYNLAFTKQRSLVDYKKALDFFVNHTKNGKMYGQWNDYGRLLSY